MKLRGIEFGSALGASGVQGFFGEGWPHYRIPLRKPNFSGMTFVSKTATLHPRAGNVKKNGGILDYFFPSWAKVKLFSGHTLNAMGLPNEGMEALLKCGKWQERDKPLFISVMAVEDSPEKRIDEFRHIIDIIGEYKNEFWSPFGLQINLSCPNTGHHSASVKEYLKVLNIAGALGVPLMPKYAIDTASTRVVMELNNHPYCDGICVSNTIKYGCPVINWKKIFGTNISPLAHLGGGGLSGPALLPHVCRWIECLRDLGFTKPVNGGGGIFYKQDVDKYHQAGASSIFVGTVATHHPRRVAGIIQHANTLVWK